MYYIDVLGEDEVITRYVYTISQEIQIGWAYLQLEALYKNGELMAHRKNPKDYSDSQWNALFRIHQRGRSCYLRNKKGKKILSYFILGFMGREGRTYLYPV